MRESELIEESCQMMIEKFLILVPALAETTSWQQALGMDSREYGMTARRSIHMGLYLITTRATLSFDLGGYEVNPSKI